MIVFCRSILAQIGHILGILQVVWASLRGSSHAPQAQNPRIEPHSRNRSACGPYPRPMSRSAKSAFRSLSRCNSSLCQLSSNWSDSSFCRLSCTLSREGSNSAATTDICSPFNNKKREAMEALPSLSAAPFSPVETSACLFICFFIIIIRAEVKGSDSPGETFRRRFSDFLAFFLLACP